MRTIVLSVFFSFFLITPAYSVMTPPDSLFALPDSNRVTLWDMHAHRNCAAEYRMEISREGQHITWIQRDTNGYAYCYCNFDYSVKFGPLQAGDYVAEVFFTEAYDTVLIPLGSISFSILEPLTDSMVVFEPFSSKCGGLYLDTKEKFPAGTILGQNYPNPFGESTRIPVNPGLSGPQVIEIFNSFGEKIRGIPFTGAVPVEVTVTRTDDLGNRLPPGIYYYSVKSSGAARFQRMVVMD